MWAIAIAVVLLLVIFGAVAVHGLDMLTGAGDSGDGPALTAHAGSIAAGIPLVGGLVVVSGDRCDDLALLPAAAHSR